MKFQLILPVVIVVGLVACSKETSAPATSSTATAVAASPATEVIETTEGLTQLPDQLTAEEIQGRREAWVSGGAPGGAAADPRMAAAPTPSRE